MKKYNSRYEYTISRTNESNNKSDHWLSEIEKNLTKQAVQPRRVDQSMFEQINSIINGKGKFKSVQDAVEEMQRRSGYLDYINKKVANEDKSSKHNESRLFKEYPEIKITFKNYCESTKGKLAVPSIIEHVKSIHRNDVNDSSLWDEESLIQAVHDLNQASYSEDSEKSHNLGKLEVNRSDDDIDPANNDAWDGLMPATKDL